MSIEDTWAEAVRLEMGRRGFTRAGLARAADVERTRLVNAIERMTHMVSLGLAIPVCRALGIDLLQACGLRRGPAFEVVVMRAHEARTSHDLYADDETAIELFVMHRTGEPGMAVKRPGNAWQGVDIEDIASDRFDAIICLDVTHPHLEAVMGQARVSDRQPRLVLCEAAG